MESCRIVNDCKKIISNIDTRFFCCNSLYSGVVKEVSESCMCIETKCYIPLNSKTELLIPFNNNVLCIPVRVRGHLHTVCQHDVISVEILNPSPEYLEFITILSLVS
jgi:hypothetical protein